MIGVSSSEIRSMVLSQARDQGQFAPMQLKRHKQLLEPCPIKTSNLYFICSIDAQDCTFMITIHAEVGITT